MGYFSGATGSGAASIQYTDGGARCLQALAQPRMARGRFALFAFTICHSLARTSGSIIHASL
ncbi:uncharacterized protein LAESUDRAFT_731568, partial [Laetiporus sulphureus 93-53]